MSRNNKLTQLKQKLKELALSGIMMYVSIFALKTSLLPKSTVEQSVVERVLENEILDSLPNNDQNLIVDKSNNRNDNFVSPDLKSNSSIKTVLSIKRGGNLFRDLFPYLYDTVAEAFSTPQPPKPNRPTRVAEPDSVPEPDDSIPLKDQEICKEPSVLDHKEALAILDRKYGSKSMKVLNGRLKIENWQAAKKIEHAPEFGINLADYGFSTSQAAEINQSGGGIAAYVEKGKELPSNELITAYQLVIKNFCEGPHSVMNDRASFQGKSAVVFLNPRTGHIAIFNSDTNAFITAYRLSGTNLDRYLTNGTIGKNY
jgi:hypothetical protein